MQGRSVFHINTLIGKGPTARSFEIYDFLVRIGESFTVILADRSTGDQKWKIQDENEQLHDLPFSFTSKRLWRKLTIVPICDDVSEQHYFLRIYLEVELKQPIPIATMHSITTVEVKLNDLPRGACPNMSIRKKGENEWQTMAGSLITFTGCDEIYEAQLEYKHPLSNFWMKSHILEVACMWQKFDIKKKMSIDYEALYIHRKFNYSIDSSYLYRTQYTATMRMIEPSSHEDYNREAEVTSYMDEAAKRSTEFKFVPGARYEFKMNIKGIGVSIPRIIEVPPDSPVDPKLWQKFFGDVDQVTFTARDHEGEQTQVDIFTMVRTVHQCDIEWRYLTLYQSGIYSYKYARQRNENSNFYAPSSSGGTFRLVQTNTTTARLILSKLFKSRLEARKPSKVLSQMDPADLTPTPTPLCLPDLIRIINYYANDHQQPTYRLVCKTWCMSIDANIAGTVTPTSLYLFDRSYTR